MSALDERKAQVLKAVVDDYTETAQPVGSQQLAARHFTRWSSATIRNELASLMESGHLRQPHTSSGRIPSDLGYRYFVDFLMRETELNGRDRHDLDLFFLALPADLEAILEGTAMALARAAANVGLVTSPRTTQSRLKYVDLVHLDGRRVLALVVLEGNVVRQQLLELQEEIDQERLSTLSGRINYEQRATTGEALGAWARTADLDPWATAAATAIADFMVTFDSQSATIIVHDGVRNLIRQPEFVDSERLLPILEVLEESSDLIRVLESVDPEGAGGQVEVVIGDENQDNHLRHCSLVVTNYGASPVQGTMGTIGPTRMPYAQVVAQLRYISRLAGESIARLYQ